MRAYRGLIILTMFLVAVAYWIAAQPKQQIDLSGAASSSTSEVMMKDPVDFELRDVKGQAVRLSSFKGRPVLLNFWASWCPPCVEELPSLLEFAKWARETHGVEVVAVSVDEEWAPVKSLLNSQLVREAGTVEKKLWPEAELPLTILLDADSKVAGEYGATKYPETYFIDRNFKIIRKFVGPQHWTSQEIKQWVGEFSSSAASGAAQATK